jgi:pimeloyl-ACP methyl ester carboxylesterase
VNRTVKRLAVGVGAAAVATGAAVAAERSLLRRARAVPDPHRGEPLTERPGEEVRVRSFDGTELAAVVVGPKRTSGADLPTLVFAHGFTLDLTTWYFQWRHFARRYRCVLFDQRGHGRSEPGASGDYSLEALGRDLKAVLDAAVPDGTAVLIGHSMGGMAILSLATHHPEEFGSRVVGAVLADTAAADLLKEAVGGILARVAVMAAGTGGDRGSRVDRLERVRRMAGGRGFGIAFLAARAINFGADAPPSLVDHVTRIAASTPVEVWTDMGPSLLEMDLTHALEHVRVPTLVLVGDVDRLTPQVSARAMVDALPEGRILVLAGAGHCAMLERPDDFNAEIETFLAEVAGAPAERELA